MAISFDSSRPIYLQLASLLEKEIASGKYQPGEKIPSVREFSLQFQVNPNTMQKALTELENRGIVCTRRGTGRFVVDDETAISRQREEKAGDLCARFVSDMRALGFDDSQILQYVKEEFHEQR